MQVLITGANRGIGMALEQHYAGMGASVYGTARQPIGAHMALNVTDPVSLATLASQITAPLDLLICNAGVYLDKAQALDTGFAAPLWADSFAVNVTGVFHTVQAFLPHLRAARGKIAIISSAMGSDSRAPGGSYIYRASKAAALNLGRNMAADFAPDGIAVGIYHPGWVKTDMGGQGADITPAQSAQGLVQCFSRLSLQNTGCFESYDGTAVPF